VARASRFDTFVTRRRPGIAGQQAGFYKNRKVPRYIWPDFLQYLCEDPKLTNEKQVKGKNI